MYLGIISNLKPLSRLTEMTKLSELTKLFELTELASTGTNLPVCPVSPRESQTEREADPGIKGSSKSSSQECR